MKKYEFETGKKAVWRGIVTEGFKKWQRGEKIYEQDKERINVLISEETKNIWSQFTKEKKIGTISNLVRNSVYFYIDLDSKMEEIKKFTEFSHDLKEELSSIMGFSQMLIEDYKDELSWDVLMKIKEIFDRSVNIETIMKNILNSEKFGKEQYDVLIVDDNNSTINLISSFLKKNGISYKGISLGKEAMKFLQKNVPKLILLDILLPDCSGYDICEKIKSDENLKIIPVYYITAVPESEVDEKLKETGAEGYFLKPFNMSKFKNLLNYF